MALHGQLKFKETDRKYGIVECEYEFSQSIDETGKPVSRTRGGTITFVMPSTSDDDLFFYKWMFNKTEVKNGKFTFVVWSNENRKSYKTVRFERAFCVGLKDYFNDSDSKLMYTTVTLSAEKIFVGENDYAMLNNEWT